MQNWLKYLLIAVLVIGAGIITVLIFTNSEGSGLRVQGSTNLIVAATINPIADIARNVAGDAASVKTIMPPGASPHTFEPTPKEVIDLKDASLIFAVGQGVDNWASTLASNLSQAQLIYVKNGITPIQDDAHYWMNTDNGKIIAYNIASELAKLDPAHAEQYKTNLKAYENKLDAANLEIKDSLREIKSNKIITHHNAWNYFAKAYGLQVLGAIESSEGKEPTPADLARLGNLAKDNNVKYIYVEPQLSEEVVKSFANDYNLKIANVDGLGTGSYIDMLKNNAAVFAQTLK